MRYLGFLLDLDDEHQRVVRASVHYRPTPTVRPTTAFEWLVVKDVEDTVAVIEVFEGTLRVVGRARWRSHALADCMCRGSSPTAFQWDLVQTALRTEVPAIPHDVPTDPTWLAPSDRTPLLPLPPPRDGTRAGVATALPADRGVWLRRGLVLAMVAGMTTILIVPWCLDRGGARREAPVVAAVVPADAAVVRVSPDAAIAAPSAPADLASALAADDATVLERYASRHLRWEEISTAQTTLGKVLKDPIDERGKALCVAGTIRTIERREVDVEGRKIYDGQLVSDEGDALAFVAVGGTGELVRRSRGTLCGIVRGKVSGALVVVGMFDLPENRTPLVERE